MSSYIYSMPDDKLFFSRLVTKNLRTVESNRRLFEGILTVEMKDRQGEITVRDELLKVLPIWIARGGPITDTHSNRVVGQGINFGSTDITDKDGKSYPAITITGEIFKDYELDDEIWKSIKSGKYKGLSFGGATKSARTPIMQKDGSMAYSLKDLEQYEVAVCEEPAVPLALITQHNEVAKAMAGNVQDRGDGTMCIRCDKFKCYVEKSKQVTDELMASGDKKIPFSRTGNVLSSDSGVSDYEEDLNNRIPLSGKQRESYRGHSTISGTVADSLKGDDSFADVRGPNTPNKDDEAEALENNRGEPQENGATYHGTDKTYRDPDPKELDPKKIEANALTASKQIQVKDDKAMDADNDDALEEADLKEVEKALRELAEGLSSAVSTGVNAFAEGAGSETAAKIGEDLNSTITAGNDDDDDEDKVEKMDKQINKILPLIAAAASGAAKIGAGAAKIGSRAAGSIRTGAKETAGSMLGACDLGGCEGSGGGLEKKHDNIYEVEKNRIAEGDETEYGQTNEAGKKVNRFGREMPKIMSKKPSLTDTAQDTPGTRHSTRVAGVGSSVAPSSPDMTGEALARRAAGNWNTPSGKPQPKRDKVGNKQVRGRAIVTHDKETGITTVDPSGTKGGSKKIVRMPTESYFNNPKYVRGKALDLLNLTLTMKFKPVTSEARRGLVQDTRVRGTENNQNKLQQEANFINTGTKIKPTGADATLTDDDKELGKALQIIKIEARKIEILEKIRRSKPDNREDNLDLDEPKDVKDDAYYEHMNHQELNKTDYNTDGVVREYTDEEDDKKTKAKGDYCPGCGKNKLDLPDTTTMGGACPNCGHGFKPKEKNDTSNNYYGEPPHGGNAGREPGETRDNESQSNLHPMNKPVKDDDADALKKDSLIKIEDDEDEDTKATILDEWKHEQHPDKNNGKKKNDSLIKTERRLHNSTGTSKFIHDRHFITTDGRITAHNPKSHEEQVQGLGHKDLKSFLKETGAARVTHNDKNNEFSVHSHHPYTPHQTRTIRNHIRENRIDPSKVIHDNYHDKGPGETGDSHTHNSAQFPKGIHTNMTDDLLSDAHKNDRAMTANNAEDGINGKMRLDNDEPAETFQEENKSEIKESKNDKDINTGDVETIEGTFIDREMNPGQDTSEKLEKNSMNIADPGHGSGGVRVGAAYDNAQQGTGQKDDPRVEEQENYSGEEDRGPKQKEPKYSGVKDVVTGSSNENYNKSVLDLLKIQFDLKKRI